MTRENLQVVKERARDLFLYKAPAFLRWGEPLLNAVDAVTAYAYREGKRAEHEQHQDEHLHNRTRLAAAFSDNKGLLSNLVTLAVSSTAASGAAVAVGPVVPPLLGWGVALLIVVVVLAKAFWSSPGGKSD